MALVRFIAIACRKVNMRPRPDFHQSRLPDNTDDLPGGDATPAFQVGIGCDVNHSDEHGFAAIALAGFNPEVRLDQNLPAPKRIIEYRPDDFPGYGRDHGRASARAKINSFMPGDHTVGLNDPVGRATVV